MTSPTRFDAIAIGCCIATTTEPQQCRSLSKSSLKRMTNSDCHQSMRIGETSEIQLCVTNTRLVFFLFFFFFIFLGPPSRGYLLATVSALSRTFTPKRKEDRHWAYSSFGKLVQFRPDLESTAPQCYVRWVLDFILVLEKLARLSYITGPANGETEKLSCKHGESLYRQCKYDLHRLDMRRAQNAEAESFSKVLNSYKFSMNLLRTYCCFENVREFLRRFREWQ